MSRIERSTEEASTPASVLAHLARSCCIRLVMSNAVYSATTCGYDRHPKYTALTKRYFLFLPLSMSSGLTPTATQAGSSLVWAPS